MSVCSAATAASSRPPGYRRESRSSSTRASTSEPQFLIERPGTRIVDPRKYSTTSTTKQSSGSNWCCVISVLMALIVVCHFQYPGDYIG